MTLAFYLRRFAFAFVLASAFITIGQCLKGHAFELALPDGLLWGAISAAVYTLVLAYKVRNSACLPKDR